MAPPFLAYYAVDTFDEELLQDTVEQCGFYREALQANISHSVPYKGVWEHIVGPQSADLGLWSTGNAWAAGGKRAVHLSVAFSLTCLLSRHDSSSRYSEKGHIHGQLARGIRNSEPHSVD